MLALAGKGGSFPTSHAPSEAKSANAEKHQRPSGRLRNPTIVR